MRNHFASLHATTLLAYYLAGAVGVMLFQSPTAALTALGLCLVQAVLLRGVRKAFASVGGVLPLLLMMCVVNALLNPRGTTVLFTVFGSPVSLEVLVYSLTMGGMLLALVLVLGLMQETLGADRLRGLFTRALPGLGLALSMTLCFVPQLRAAAVRRAGVHKALGQDPADGGLRLRVRRAAAVLSATAAGALERTLITAGSMRARGYELSGRRANLQRKPGLRDGLLLGSAGLFLGVCIAAAVTGLCGFAFYPTLAVPGISPWRTGFYVFYALYFALPVLYNLTQEWYIQWLLWKM